MVDLYARILDDVDDDDAMITDLSVVGTGVLSGAGTHVDNVDGQIITAEEGAFVVTRDASTPVSANIDDTGAVKTYSLKFDAQNDSYVIAEAYITIANTTAVSSVSLKDGSQVVGTAVPGNGGAVSFTGMVVPVAANTYKILDVEVTMAPVGYGAGTSGASLQPDFVEAVVRVGATGDVGNVATHVVTDSTVIGNAIYQYKAIPTISLVSLPSTVLGAGEKTLMKFTIATNGTGQIAWKKVVVTVAKTDIPFFTDDSVALFDADTGLEIVGVGTTPGADDCAADANTCTVTFIVGTDDDTAEEQISGSKTYELRAVVQGAIDENDYISSRILGSGIGHANNDHYADVSDTGATFIWSDMSSQSHATTTPDWINDNLIRTIPTSTQTLTK
jgi:hypothetical protein